LPHIPGESILSDITPNPSLVWRIIQFPIVRILLGFVAVLAPVVLWQWSFDSLTHGIDRKSLPFQLGVIPLCMAALASYWAFVRWIEKRQVTELSRPKSIAEWSAGVVVGALMMVMTIGAIAAVGDFTVSGVNPATVLIPFIGVAFSSGVIEELLLRGLFFRIIEEWAGSWIALASSALLFGALHLANPNATIVAAAAISLEAGLMLAAAYMVTRRLWFPIGIHMAWNFVQGGVFGVAVSGNASKGLLQSSLTGTELVSGGAFGAESSIFAVIFGLILTVIFLRRAKTKAQFRLGRWQQQKGQ
jgi:uncharacterized protein